MGLLISVVSKFRKKTTTKEILQQIEEDIEECQSTLQKNRQRQKTTVLFLLTTSFLIYFIAAVVFYLWYLPTKLTDRLLLLLPFLGFPFIVYFLRKILHFVFVTRISKNARKLEELKKEKKKILESVMETETYKIAKEILQKYDPGRKLVERDTPTKETQPSSQGQELRKRNMQTPFNQNNPAVRPSNTQGINNTPRIIHGPGMQTPMPMHLRFQTPQTRGPTPHPRLPHAPILPRDRSLFDKVAEYLVGDGPSNRYALICAQCFSHNGMALMEEFEYTAFKCCYCQFFNPARKHRLNAPKLVSDVKMSKGSSDESNESANDSTQEDKDTSDVIETKRKQDEAVTNGSFEEEDEREDDNDVNVVESTDSSKNEDIKTDDAEQS